ncbi:uncharacterized protein LOC135629834 [Musa acuminata AAA Group]|uniref:uncharacterized protein LOC135629834 n=1 Tax=Musa acuminata AAA Group TaxID=214697 RepID=UPI0031CFD284
MEEPLDFEEEDQLVRTPLRPTNTNKRSKVIGLDDLLTDYYEEKNKYVHRKSKRLSLSKRYNSDEDDKSRKYKERMLSKFVHDCEKQVNEMSAEEEIPLWGQRVFGHQKSLPSTEYKGVADCQLLQSSSIGDLISVIYLNEEQGESFLEGLLVNRWLCKLAFVSGFVEDSIATWVFNKMLYSSNGELQVSACEFWCDILLSKDEADKPSVSLGWFPGYSQLMDALATYGYLFDTSMSRSSLSQEVHTDKPEGPPENISSWIKVISACCQIRSPRSIFSISEAEELLCIIIHFSLDRELQGLLFIINEGMQSIIRFFSEEEWDVSCKRVAKSLAFRTPKDLNCLRVVECISVTNGRSKQLRSQIALQLLTLRFDIKVNDYKEILELLMSVNVKDKDCDFFKLYIYLVLAENFLSFHHLGEEKSVAIDTWCKFLRNCSSQITSTDWRSYASKVRNKASYILQTTVEKST